jgi:uncharacterized Zn finger protein
MSEVIKLLEVILSLENRITELEELIKSSVDKHSYTCSNCGEIHTCKMKR